MTPSRSSSRKWRDLRFLGSARQSVKVFVLRRFLETHILVVRSRQRQDSQFAVEMTLGGTSGLILAEDLLPVPPSLETRTKRGFPYFHSDHGGGLLIATRPNPNKIGGLTDSCTEPIFDDTSETSLVFAIAGSEKAM
jgi:hypothetical protein